MADRAARNEKSIFQEAVEIELETERAKYVQEACSDDRELLAKVEALLQAYQKPCGVLAAPEAEAPTDAMSPLTEGPGTTIGPYKLMEQIGEGGMGVVFVAEQQKPVRRRVALKIIKPGMDTKEVVARFEAERQALALMDHPNIARVLDAGTTGSGLPYFVMELVRGIPINDHCDKNNLTTGERLALFLPVCHAIQHAHQKGIIHRDIKPSNVMVTLHDGVAVPKIIDFGVAKAISQRLTERTVYTRYAQMVGTPLYMSPEQAEMSGLDIDTRSDVYSLGVLLYELLTGTTPFDQKRLREAAYDELLRIIREEEPPKPSTRISSLGDSAVAVSAHRKTEPKRLGQLLHGDLDWIVMKALEKDRGRRYETANGFAADIKRYLDDEPVLACPPSAAYLFRKFARRNKAVMTTVGLVAASLVLGVVVSTGLAISADIQRGRAVVARQAASQEQQRAVDAERTANHQRDLARDAERRAQDQRDENRRLLYPADMIRAHQAWDAGDVTGALEILQRHVPQEGEEDLRGFHWTCLRRLCDRSLARKPLHFPGRICGVALSPHGRLVAASGYDEPCYVWNIATGDRMDSNLSGWSVACSPNDAIFAVCDMNGINRWNPDTGMREDALPYSSGAALFLAWSGDGSRVATAGFDRKASVWDLTQGGGPRVFHGPEFVCFSVALSPDGRWVAAAAAELFMWDVEGDGEPIVLKQDVDSAFCTAFAHDGTTLASGGYDGRIKLWDIETRRRKRVLRSKNDAAVLSLACSADGRLAAGAEDGSVTLSSLDDGEQMGVLKGHQHSVWAVDFSEDSRTLASGSMDGEVRTWDVANRRPTDELTHPTQQFTSVALSPDDSVAATTSADHVVTLWDVQTGEELESIPAHRNLVLEVAISPSGDCLASVSMDGTVRVWDLALGVQRSLLKQDLSLAVTFSPDGQTMAVGGAGGHLHLWDPATGAHRLKCDFTGRQIRALAMSPDSQILASGGWDSTIMLWEVSTGQHVGTLTGHDRDVRCLAFSPDDKTLASCAGDGTVKLWDVAAREEQETLSGHSATVFSVAFSPDGTILASGGGDNTVKLWYLGTNREPESLPTNAPAVSVTFSADGRTLASASGDTVRFWRTVDVEGSDELDRLWDVQRRARKIAERGPQEQRQIVDEIRSHLTAGVANGLLRRDIVLATATAWRLENGGHDELAAEAFRCFGEAISRGEDPRFSGLASGWEAASCERRGRLCLEAGQYDEAIAHFTKAVANKPNDRQLRVTRGRLCVFQSQWKEAAADYTRAIELDPSDIMTWLRTAPLLVLAEDLEGYRNHCNKMALQFAESERDRDASIICKARLLLPDAVDASTLPLEMLESTLDDRSAPSWFYKWGYLHLAMAALRTGEAERTAHWISKSQESQGYANAHPLRALALSLMAMAQHQLGNHQEAREALVQADKLMKEYLPKLASGELGAWHDWLIAELLRREAEQLIGTEDPGDGADEGGTGEAS